MEHPLSLFSCRLQSLVMGLQGELEELRAQFETTVEQARVDGVSTSLIARGHVLAPKRCA